MIDPWKCCADKNAASYSGDHRWIKAKYPGVADDGTPFKKGEEVLYWPSSRTFQVGSKAKAAYAKFQSEAADEAFYNRDYMASDRTAKDAPHVENDLKSVINKLESAGEAVKGLQDAFEKYTKDPQRYKPQLNNAQQSSISLASIGRALAKLFEGLNSEDIDKQYIDEMRLHMASDKTAGDSSHRSWASLYGSVVANFVGSCGEGLFEYIQTLHGRLESSPAFDFTGFTSWDYGNVSQKGDEWFIRVWGADNNAYPEGVRPNLQIAVKFDQDDVYVRLLMDNRTVLLNKKFNGGVTPSSIGLACGEVWEKLLTKRVEYGPGEVDHFASVTAGEGCSGGCVGCGSVYCSGDCGDGCDCDAPDEPVVAGEPEVANWLAEEASEPVVMASEHTAGAAQDYLTKKIDGWKAGDDSELSDIARGYKGNFKELMSAANVLKKKGLIDFDGHKVTKKASETPWKV